MTGRKIGNIVVAVMLYMVSLLLLFADFDFFRPRKYLSISIGLAIYVVVEFIMYMLWNRQKMYIVCWRLAVVSACAILTMMWQNQQLLIVMSICCFVPIILQFILNLAKVELKINFQDNIEFFFPILLLLQATFAARWWYYIYASALILFTSYGIIDWAIEEKKAKSKELAE